MATIDSVGFKTTPKGNVELSVEEKQKILAQRQASLLERQAEEIITQQKNNKKTLIENLSQILQVLSLNDALLSSEVRNAYVTLRDG